MLVVLLLLLGAAGSQASAEQTILCGRELAKAHSMYCYDVDSFPTEAFDSDFSSPKTDPKVSSMKIPERFALRAAKLAETCCLKPCYVSEILNHC